MLIFYTDPRPKPRYSNIFTSTWYFLRIAKNKGTLLHRARAGFELTLYFHFSFTKNLLLTCPRIKNQIIVFILLSCQILCPVNY